MKLNQVSNKSLFWKATFGNLSKLCLYLSLFVIGVYYTLMIVFSVQFVQKTNEMFNRKKGVAGFIKNVEKINRL